MRSLLVAIGFGLSLWKARRIASLVGTVIMGLGVLFIGLSMMSDFMAPLRTYQPFLDLMASMTNPLLGILIGALFTAIVQSSSATLGVIIALATQGLIPLEAGIALVFGANIGTTITGLLATIGQPRAALHAAVGLVGFKVLLVLIWLPLIGPLEQITRAVSPSAEGLALAEQLAYEVPRQVANVHLIVNLTHGAGPAAVHQSAGRADRARDRRAGRSREGHEAMAPALNPVLFEMPPMAIDAARRELLHLGERVARSARRGGAGHSRWRGCRDRRLARARAAHRPAPCRDRGLRREAAAAGTGARHLPGRPSIWSKRPTISSPSATWWTRK